MTEFIDLEEKTENVLRVLASLLLIPKQKQ